MGSGIGVRGYYEIFLTNQNMEIEFTDRYKATGTPYPTKDSCTVCDGMGYFPNHKSTLNRDALNARGGRIIVVGQTGCEEDDFVFVKCPECCGSRMKTPAEEIEYGGHKWKRVTPNPPTL